MEYENNREIQNGAELDFKILGTLICRFWYFILGAGLLCAAAVYLYMNATFVPTYTADVKIGVYNSNVLDATSGKVDDSSEFDKAAGLATYYMDILSKSRDPYQKVIDKFELDQQGCTVSMLRSMVKVSLAGNSEHLFVIYVTHPDPETATNILTELTNVFFDSVAKVGTPMLVDPPVPAEDLKPSASSAKIFALFAFVIGAFIMTAALYIWKLLDTRVRSAQDIARYSRYAVLGEIPRMHTEKKSDQKGEEKR